MNGRIFPKKLIAAELFNQFLLFWNPNIYHHQYKSPSYKPNHQFLIFISEPYTNFPSHQYCRLQSTDIFLVPFLRKECLNIFNNGIFLRSRIQISSVSIVFRIWAKPMTNCGASSHMDKTLFFPVHHPDQLWDTPNLTFCGYSGQVHTQRLQLSPPLQKQNLKRTHILWTQ